MDFIKNHIWQILIGVNYLLALAAAFTILLKKLNPTKTLSYIIVLLVFPFFGLIVYYFFGQEYRKSKIFRRKSVLNSSVVKNIQDKIKIESKTLNEVTEMLDEKSKLIALIYNSENSKLSVKNAVEIIKNGDKKFHLLIEDLKQAKHHIHLEYFIIKDDTIGTAVLDILCEKAQDGIEVRLVLDDVGSSISSNMRQKLKKCGVELHFFMPVFFSSFTGKMNYRDHRKIAIIDGAIGYLGGINISDNYINKGRNGYWRDTHLRIEGEAVKQLQILFLTTWEFVSSTQLDITEVYFPSATTDAITAVQITASGPDTDWENIMEAIFSAITNAEDYIYITTPYFIPNDEIITALQVAAKSNIKVKLILPKKSDSWTAQYATNSYIKELLTAGVEVYQYTKGFIHAKTMVIDNVLCTIGTANMDYRSFSINFEVNALIYNAVSSLELKNQFLEDIEDADLLNKEIWSNRSKKDKALESVARLLAPLL